MRTAALPIHATRTLLTSTALAVALAAAAAASLPAQAMDWRHAFGGSVTGSGTIKSETRAVSGFSGVALSLDASVQIQQGAAEGVTVEADDNLLPLIETVVEGGILKIRPATRNGSLSSRHLKIVVRAKTIDRLSIAGSGDIYAETLKTAKLNASIAGAGDLRIKSLDTDALGVKIAGSGDFDAAGRAASLHASIAGSGDVKAARLEAKDVEVSIAGSGDANVWARETLKVKVAGSGDVKYYGDAALQKSVVGSGEIKRLGAAPASP